jgi:hypothetical protein
MVGAEPSNVRNCWSGPGGPGPVRTERDLDLIRVAAASAAFRIAILQEHSEGTPAPGSSCLMGERRTANGE